MNAVIRKLSMIATLASSVALAQSTTPGGPGTGMNTDPRPTNSSDKPATGMGNDNATKSGSAVDPRGTTAKDKTATGMGNDNATKSGSATDARSPSDAPVATGMGNDNQSKSGTGGSGDTKKSKSKKHKSTSPGSSATGGTGDVK